MLAGHGNLTMVVVMPGYSSVGTRAEQSRAEQSRAGKSGAEQKKAVQCSVVQRNDDEMWYHGGGDAGHG